MTEENNKRCNNILGKLKTQEEIDIAYQQLARSEQERDELKKVCEKCKLFDIEKTNRDLLERIDKLEQENKELKKQNKILEIQIDQCNEYIAELKEYSQRMENQRENYYKEYNNYRSALEEIKNCIDTYTSVENDFENSESYLRIMEQLKVLN